MSGGAVIDDELEGLGADDVSDEQLLARLDALQQQMLALKAAEARVLAEVDRRKLFRSGGHVSMYGLLRSRYGWSDGECKQAMTIARGGVRFGWFLETLDDGTMPVSHAEAALRAAMVLDRAGYAAAETELGFLANEAGLEHDQFVKRVRSWQFTNHPDRANRDSQSQRDRRHATVTITESGCTVTASLDSLDGAELLEILANFVDAEFTADWNAAVALHGDDVSPALLDRTDRQRQADALMAIARTAAEASPTIGGDSDPLVMIVVDERTLADALTELQWGEVDAPGAEAPCDGATCRPDALELIEDLSDPLLPSQRRCETTNGVVIDPRTAVLAALIGHVRWMMVDQLGNPLAVTSKQRLFRGPMRAAVMSMSDRCICPGCRQRTGAGQADHLDEHQHGGATAITNGAPICPRHNRFKSRHGYRPRRDHRGHWHLYDQHGNPVT